MNVETLPFRSIKSADDPHPWYEVAVDEADGKVRVTNEQDGGLSGGLRTAETKTPDHVDFPQDANSATGKRIDYGVTTDGDFIAYDSLEYDPDLRIRLVIYFADAGVHYHGNERLEVDADTMLVLNFYE